MITTSRGKGVLASAGRAPQSLCRKHVGQLIWIAELGALTSEDGGLTGEPVNFCDL